MGHHDSRGRGGDSRDSNRSGRRDDRRDDSTYDSAYDSTYDRAYDSAYDSRYDDAAGSKDGREARRRDEPDADAALAVVGEEERALASRMLLTEEAPVVVPGSGQVMGNPFIARRQRPLTMRLAIVFLIACMLLGGLFSVTPLGASAGGNMTTFQELAGSVILNQNMGYRWYVTKPGDTPESISAKFGVTIGGIYELNNLVVGQDLPVGVPLKVSEDPNYGADYRAPSFGTAGGGGNATTFGSDWWNSNAGTPLPEQPCAPNGGANPLGYHLTSPNPGSYFVRGYSWFHNGVDIAQPAGAPIYAAQAGVVIWAGWTNTGFGNSVVISHCYYLETLYGHMAKVLVHAGEFVQDGQQIGIEGQTGWATGPHLHLSVLVHGQFVNPMDYFKSVYTLTHRS